MFSRNTRTFSFLLFLLTLISSIGFSQNVINEYSNFECSQAKQLKVPFPESANVINGKSLNAINQVTFYEHRNQFSYWYKLTVTKDRIIHCKIKPIDANDSYVLYIYRYKKDDFCNKVFYGKMNPLKASSFLNYKTQVANFELSDVQLKVKKGEAYYFCVLNTSPSNCGHIMQLIEGKDSLNIKAIHFPCTEEEEEEPEPKVKKVEEEKVAVVLTSLSKTLDTITVNTMADSKVNKNVAADLTITEELTGNKIAITTTGKYSYEIVIEKGANYNVECLATGYKDFGHSIVISEYVDPDSNRFDIYLKPLKAGDNFVMENIYFYPNTYALRRGSEKELNYLLNYLINNPEVKVELQGHTNGNNRCKKNRAYRKKGPEWNYSGTAKKLSQFRSDAIKKYLVEKGVLKQNIVTKGFGGERMIILNPKTLAAIDKNIRVEVVILKDSGL